MLDIYEWQYWDGQQEKWIPIDTNYNNIESGWEATLVGGKITFALIKTGEITTLTYTNPGGGIFAPSFSIGSLLFSFIAVVILKNVNLKKNKKLR